jgi:hypothetical protein
MKTVKHIRKPNTVWSSLKISLSDYDLLKLIHNLEIGGIDEFNKEYIKDILGIKYNLYAVEKHDGGTWYGKAKNVILELKNGKTRDIGHFEDRK